MYLIALITLIKFRFFTLMKRLLIRLTIAFDCRIKWINQAKPKLIFNWHLIVKFRRTMPFCYRYVRLFTDQWVGGFVVGAFDYYIVIRPLQYTIWLQFDCNFFNSTKWWLHYNVETEASISSYENKRRTHTATRSKNCIQWTIYLFVENKKQNARRNRILEIEFAVVFPPPLQLLPRIKWKVNRLKCSTI